MWCCLSPAVWGLRGSLQWGDPQSHMWYAGWGGPCDPCDAGDWTSVPMHVRTFKHWASSLALWFTKPLRHLVFQNQSLHQYPLHSPLSPVFLPHSSLPLRQPLYFFLLCIVIYYLIIYVWVWVTSLCPQGSLVVGFGRPYGMLGI